MINLWNVFISHVPFYAIFQKEVKKLSPTVFRNVFFFYHVTTITHLKVKNKGIKERMAKKIETSKAYGPKSGQGPLGRVNCSIRNKEKKRLYVSRSRRQKTRGNFFFANT